MQRLRRALAVMMVLWMSGLTAEAAPAPISKSLPYELACRFTGPAAAQCSATAQLRYRFGSGVEKTAPTADDLLTVRCDDRTLFSGPARTERSGARVVVSAAQRKGGAPSLSVPQSVFSLIGRVRTTADLRVDDVRFAATCNLRRLPFFASYAYAGGAGIAAFALNESSGALSAVAGSPFLAGASVWRVTGSRDGRHLFVAASDGLHVLRISFNGALTEVLGSPYAAGTTPALVAAHPYLPYVYASQQILTTPAQVFGFVQGASGRLTPIAGLPLGIGSDPRGLAVDPLGRFVYALTAGALHVLAIHPATGALTEVAGSPFATEAGARSLATEPFGQHVYVGVPFDGSVHAFTVASGGALTPVAGTPFASGGKPEWMDMSPDGRFLATANGIADSVSNLAMSGGSGSAVPGSPIGAARGVTGVAFDPLGRYLYATTLKTSSVIGWSVNPTTGELTELTAVPGRVLGLIPQTITVLSVPQF